MPKRGFDYVGAGCQPMQSLDWQIEVKQHIDRATCIDDLTNLLSQLDNLAQAATKKCIEMKESCLQTPVVELALATSRCDMCIIDCGACCNPMPVQSTSRFRNIHQYD